MIYNTVAAQKYNTNMSALWFVHNLHGYNSLSTGSRLSRARRLHHNDWPCASDSLFQASVAQSPSSLSRQYPILIPLSASRQSLRKHACLPAWMPARPTPTCQHTHLHLHLAPPTQCCFHHHPLYKLFLYHTSISQGDQYRRNSLGHPKSACLRAFARITAIDSFWLGPPPALLDACRAAGELLTQKQTCEIKMIDFVGICHTSHDAASHKWHLCLLNQHKTLKTWSHTWPNNPFFLQCN